MEEQSRGRSRHRRGVRVVRRIVELIWVYDRKRLELVAPSFLDILGCYEGIRW
jgi:hypothetical protein